MIKKSVIIAGRHNTSISLEAEFFEELLGICKEKKLSLNALVTEIDANREKKENLSSSIRIYILNHLKKK